MFHGIPPLLLRRSEQLSSTAGAGLVGWPLVAECSRMPVPEGRSLTFFKHLENRRFYQAKENAIPNRPRASTSII